jgi:hypothetical protein
MRSVGWATVLFLFGLAGAGGAPLQLVQGDACPADYPVDCGTFCCEAGSYCTGDGCCPEGTWDSGDGYCIPDGHPYCGDGKYCDPGDAIACRGICYTGAGDAVENGCPVSEHLICGGPAQ